MRKIAHEIVDTMIEGKVSDWMSDKWNDIKVATGIGHDSFGMGKPDKGFKPKYGPVRGRTANITPIKSTPRDQASNTWNIS